MDNPRLIWFVALAAILMMLWQAWEAENRPKQPATTAPQTSVAPATGGLPAVPQAGDVSSAPATVADALPKTALDARKSQKVHVVTDTIEATIDTLGGTISEVRLLKHPASADNKEEPFKLLVSEGQRFYVAQSGLIGRDGQYANHDTLFNVARTDYRLAEGKDSIQVDLNWTNRDRVRFTKRFTFKRNSYVIDVAFDVRNLSPSPWSGHFYGQLNRVHEEDENKLMGVPTYVGGAIHTPEDKYQKISFDDMKDEPLNRRVKGGWVAILQHYFVGAWMPTQDQEHNFYTKAQPGNRYIIGFTDIQPLQLAAGQQGQVSSALFIGPKETKRLKNLVEGMNLTVDFGWLYFISAPLFWLLNAIHDYVGNWGWSIILLTLFIKGIFFPLSAASYKSMANMKRVQPKLQAVKEKYGNDKQRLNQAMMELYKKEKINPLGGCLPIVIQIPVFIALYWVLLESVEMRQAPFALWIHDLSAPDPFFVLPVIMGISMFAQHMLNPAPLDPMQKRMMQILPIVFTVFFLFFPAGLVLYWVVNNVLSIAQQWQINRMIGVKD